VVLNPRVHYGLNDHILCIHSYGYEGWCDIPLTAHGEADARDAGRLLGERGLKFDIAFTSTLERAWRTCAIALSEANQTSTEVLRSWKLNERHYGGEDRICIKER
jgi:2,3-bisphosphoglycerate-dependent phosphoglycerate mutase